MSDSEAITSRSARKIAQPFIQPVIGPTARVVQANVVPASGSARLKYLYADATSSIGMNATSSTAGACTPTPLTATMNPRVAAIEYAGAVEATPMTMFEMYPIAPFFRPLSMTPLCACCGGPPCTAPLSVAIGFLSVGSRAAGCRLTAGNLRPGGDKAQGAQFPKEPARLVQMVQRL